jgi:very-short-patch-repair endonuclease
MHKLLNKLKIPFIAAYPIGYYVCDIYLPDYNLVIECQGDYWHSNPRKYQDKEINLTQKLNIRRDKAKATFLKNKGYSQLNIWEYDINYNFKYIEDLLQKVLSTIVK